MKQLTSFYYNKLLSIMLWLLGFGASGCIRAMYGPPLVDDEEDLKVNPEHLEFPASKKNSCSVYISTESNWTITHVPTFVAVSRTGGHGYSIISVTTTGDNLDSVPHMDLLMVEGNGNAAVKITQMPYNR